MVREILQPSPHHTTTFMTHKTDKIHTEAIRVNKRHSK